MTAFVKSLKNTHPIVRVTWIFSFSLCLLIIVVGTPIWFVPDAHEIVSDKINSIEMPFQNFGFTPENPTDFVI